MVDFPRFDKEPAQIPGVGFDEVTDRLREFWLPREAPHISIVAQTRWGKSHLIRHGILPLVEDEKVLIIDVKGDDKTLQGLGKPIRKIPKLGWRTFSDSLSNAKPQEHWYRLQVSEDPGAGRTQVGKALRDCYQEGNWNIVLDETRALTDPSEPNLGLRSEVEALWLRGGSRGICLIAATQGPRWVPRSFYEQAQFHFIGGVEDEDSQKRLREIGGMEKPHLQVIKDLPRFHFVYTDRMAEDGIRYRCTTKVD